MARTRDQLRAKRNKKQTVQRSPFGWPRTGGVLSHSACTLQIMQNAPKNETWHALDSTRLDAVEQPPCCLGRRMKKMTEGVACHSAHHSIYDIALTCAAVG